jgi:hypothetical protein
VLRPAVLSAFTLAVALAAPGRAMAESTPAGAGQLSVFDAWWSRVRELDEIYQRLDELARASDGRARVVTVGASVEGRPIKGLRILVPRGGEPDPGTDGQPITRPAILVTGTHHAREWASPMVTLGLAEGLVRQYLPDLRARRVVNTFAIFVVPVVNVDGYLASHRGQRMQRKNMNPRCPVDLNRNYDVAFGLGAAAGGCHEESYPGPHPFSEPETRAVKGLADSLPNLKLFLDYHAPAEQVMIPFAFTRARPPDFDRSRARAELYASTLQRLYGTLHRAREGYDLAQGQGGGAIDWFRNDGHEAFAVELRNGREQAGFQLPPEQLVPTVEENWEAFLALALAVAADEPGPGPGDAILGDGGESPGPRLAAMGCRLAGGNPAGAGLLPAAATLLLLAALRRRSLRRRSFRT